jgi:alkylation response protein AidB-like acyl-CoA dehydrogenase
MAEAARCLPDRAVEHASIFDRVDERDELRSAVRGLIDRLGGVSVARRVMETESGYDADLWSRLATELGLAGLAIAEEYDGQGATFVELAVALEELGRVVLPVPLLASAVLAAGAVDADPELLTRIAGGTPAALAQGSANATASQTGDGWHVTGDYLHVIDGTAADVLVVAVDDELYVVEGDASGLQRESLATLDQTRRQARVSLDDAPARRVEGNLARALDLGKVALAAEAVGGARWCLEATVDYAKTREQFGRPIGSFQALKHRMADMHALVETAAATAEHAAWVAAYDPDQLPLIAAMAKAHCVDAYVQIAQETIQLHGGIGFTWEHDAHLHLKRAWSTCQLLGEPRQLRSRVAELTGI